MTDAQQGQWCGRDESGNGDDALDVATRHHLRPPCPRFTSTTAIPPLDSAARCGKGIYVLLSQWRSSNTHQFNTGSTRANPFFLILTNFKTSHSEMRIEIYYGLKIILLEFRHPGSYYLFQATHFIYLSRMLCGLNLGVNVKTSIIRINKIS